MPLCLLFLLALFCALGANLAFKAEMYGLAVQLGISAIVLVIYGAAQEIAIAIRKTITK